MTVAAIVDYGTSNLDSIARAAEECGVTVRLAARPADLDGADHIVLPGVGAFPRGMANLAAAGLDGALKAKVAEGVPLLGVCLGMQLLADSGAEGGVETAGLGLIPGRVERLEAAGPDERLPHVGWNVVEVKRPDCPLFDGIPPARDFYFVHSYCYRPAETADAAAFTPYCGGFASVVWKGAVFGAQFHPEKSQRWGIKMLANFFAW